MKPGQRALGLSKVLAQEEQRSHTNPVCWINQQRYYTVQGVSEGEGQRTGLREFQSGTMSSQWGLPQIMGTMNGSYCW